MMTRSSIRPLSGKLRISGGEEVKERGGQGVRWIIPPTTTEVVGENEGSELTIVRRTG